MADYSGLTPEELWEKFYGSTSGDTYKNLPPIGKDSSNISEDMLKSYVPKNAYTPSNIPEDDPILPERKNFNSGDPDYKPNFAKDGNKSTRGPISSTFTAEDMKRLKEGKRYGAPNFESRNIIESPPPPYSVQGSIDKAKILDDSKYPSYTPPEGQGNLGKPSGTNINVSKMNPLVEGMDLLGGLAKNVNDSYRQQSSQGADVTALNPETEQQYLEAVKGLKTGEGGAEDALKNIGRVETSLANEAQGKQFAQVDKLREAQAQYEQFSKVALRDSQQRYMFNANKLEQDHINATNAAKIDPNYIGNMPWYKQIATAVGLIFSGAGSGVTGQENLAFKQLNNNIQRSIETQQATYNNLAHQELQQRGIVLTNQQEADMAMTARQLATTTALGATAAMMDGYATKLAGSTANDKAALAIQKVKQSYADSMVATNNFLTSHLKSNNAVTNNMLTAVIQATMAENDKYNIAAPKGISNRINQAITPKSDYRQILQKDTATPDEAQKIMQGLNVPSPSSDAGSSIKEKVNESSKKSILDHLVEYMGGK